MLLGPVNEELMKNSASIKTDIPNFSVHYPKRITSLEKMRPEELRVVATK